MLLLTDNSQKTIVGCPCSKAFEFEQYVHFKSAYGETSFSRKHLFERREEEVQTDLKTLQLQYIFPVKKKKNIGYVSKVAKIQTREGNLLKIKEKPFSNNRGYLWWSPILKDDNQYIKYKSFM